MNGGKMEFDFKFGEMSVYERKKLYNYIKVYDPTTVLECGAGKGASTHIMVNAVNNNSKIYSCDPSRHPDFKSELLFFHNEKSDKLISKLINDKIYPDFIFFDGPEEPEVALNDFIELDKYVEIGTIFSMHDWCTVKRKLDGAISTKANLLKPYINSLDTWELLEETSGEEYIESEESVGICFYKKILK